MNSDIDVLKLGKLSLLKNTENVEKVYDEINWIYMSDYKDSDEIY